MWIFASLLTATCFGMNNTLFKWSTSKSMSKINVQFFFYLSAFLMTLSYGIITHSFYPNILALFLGALIGILNTNGNIQMSLAFEKGPASLTSPLIAANAIFPVLSAGILFHEQVPLLHWVGILCMMCSVIVIQYTPVTAGKYHYISWIFRVTLAIASFGILGILMKTTSYLHISSLNVLIAMYGGGTCYLALKIGKERIQVTEVKVGGLVALLSVCGFSCYFFALQTGVASIVFPVVSLNCLIVIAAGCYIFKEKLKTYQFIGIISALIGLVLTKT